MVGQISKSGTVLESWEPADFKTVPDFGIWPRFDGENKEINTDAFFLGHGVSLLIYWEFYHEFTNISRHISFITIVTLQQRVVKKKLKESWSVQCAINY